MKRCFVLLLLVIFLCGCDPYYNRKPYCFGPSVWVCEEPDIVYVVESVYDEEEKMLIEEEYAVLYRDGEEIFLDLQFCNEAVVIYKKGINDYEEGHLCSGVGTYSKEKFKIKLYTDNDILFRYSAVYTEVINRLEK